MTFPGTFLRLAASGTLYGVEGFSWSLSLVPDFPTPGDTGPADVPAAVRTAVENFHKSGITTGAARLKTVKLNAIGPNGRYVNTGSTVFHDYGTTGVAGIGSQQIAPQIALAITLGTARSRGRASSGRFYLPVPNYLPGADGRISAADAETVSQQATTLLNALNAAMDGWRVGVASDVGEGAFEVVTHVRVGRVLDTIRSRRASLVEAPFVGPALAP